MTPTTSTSMMSRTCPARGQAAPFDGTLAPLPGRPALFPTEQGVIACLQDGDCWIRNSAQDDWVMLTQSPVVAWRTLPPGTPATFSELADDGSVLVVPFASTQ